MKKWWGELSFRLRVIWSILWAPGGSAMKIEIMHGESLDGDGEDGADTEPTFDETFPPGVQAAMRHAMSQNPGSPFEALGMMMGMRPEPDDPPCANNQVGNHSWEWHDKGEDCRYCGLPAPEENDPARRSQ